MTAAALYHVLRDEVQRQGNTTIYAPVITLAARLRCSERTARQAKYALRRKGLIDWNCITTNYIQVRPQEKSENKICCGFSAWKL